MWHWPDNRFAWHRQKSWIIWHSIANFYCITAKANPKERSKQFIRELSCFVTIVPTSNNDLLVALDLPFSDFEDALQCAAAMACAADVIVSRNVSDYQRAPIKALAPERLLQELKSAKLTFIEYRELSCPTNPI